jgi:hypothetical protein
VLVDIDHDLMKFAMFEAVRDEFAAQAPSQFIRLSRPTNAWVPGDLAAEPVDVPPKRGATQSRFADRAAALCELAQ